MAKPDNRADNEAHLQEHIDHTIANFREAEDYLKAHADEISADEKKVLKPSQQKKETSLCIKALVFVKRNACSSFRFRKGLLFYNSLFSIQMNRQ